MTVTGSWERAANGAMLLGADGQLSQTIFAEMSALAVATGAINLGQGFPDEDGPPEVLEAARKPSATASTNTHPATASPCCATRSLNIKNASTGSTSTPIP